MADSVSKSRRSLRDAQVAATRERLVEAAVELIESGLEPTMRAIAKQARAGERTVYRYFPTREDLEKAVGERLRGRVSAVPPASVDGLEAYVEELFGRFAANRELLAAILTARWVRAKYQTTRPRNLAAFIALFEQAFPDAPAAERRAAAAAMRVPLSGTGWMYLADCGWSDEEILAQGRWVVRQALDTLARAQRRARRKARG
jgi:AcrR family transcriptional regulator